MASLFGAFLVAIASGGLVAALIRPIREILMWIVQYIQGIYGRPTSSSKNSP